MNHKKLKNKDRMSITEIILRFFFGFLIPFVLINGVIFFLFIQTPKMQVVDQDSKDYEKNKIKFSISCILPLTNIQTFYENNEIPYTKLANQYVIDADTNGTYQIKVTALNQAVANSTFTLESLDSIAPTIDINSAIITGNTLIISAYDNQSGINYDNVCAKLEDGSQVKPSYIDKSSGTIQFQITDGSKVTIHVEDNLGNDAETLFTIS